MRASAPALLLLAAALVPTALAQLPGTTCGPVTVALDPASPSTENFGAGENRTFVFEVTNSGQLSADVSVSFADPPEGWYWSNLAEDITVPAGATGSFDASLQYIGGTSATNAEFAFNWAGGCGGPLPLSFAPASGSLALSGVPAPGGPIGGGDTETPADGAGPAWPWLLLVLGGALLVGSVFVSSRAQKGRVSVTCTETEKPISAGRGTSFPVTIANHGGKAVPVALSVHDVPQGWSALTALPSLTLGPKEERTLWLMVRAPQDAGPGIATDVRLTVTPEGAKAREVTLRAVVAGSN